MNFFLKLTPQLMICTKSRKAYSQIPSNYASNFWESPIKLKRLAIYFKHHIKCVQTIQQLDDENKKTFTLKIIKEEDISMRKNFSLVLVPKTDNMAIYQLVTFI